MIFPQKWNLKRPGLVIPVFFLSLFPALGQIPWQEASVAAIGGSFVTRSGFTDARYNQAGLGWINRKSISLQHTRPFIINKLGISSISGQVPTGEGAFGATLSAFGIRGLYHTSTWISYGMKLHPGITAGLGIHVWNSSIPEQIIFHPGFSCAMGIQARINDKLVIGGHVMHPAYWSADTHGQQMNFMIISAGCSYTFFQTATFHSDLHIMPESHIQMCQGIELELKDRIGINLGMHNRPFSVSGGIVVLYMHWTIHVAFEYMIDSGSTPSSSLTYVW